MLSANVRVAWIPLVVLVGSLNGSAREPASAFDGSAHARADTLVRQGDVRPLPRPPSARVAVERVYEVLAHVRGQGAACELRELQAGVRFHQKPDREFVCVVLSVDFPARDILSATKAYEALRAGLRVWVQPLDLRETPVTPLADGKGIRVEALELDLDLADEGAVIIAGNECYSTTEIELAVRRAGDHPWLLLGYMDCDSSFARVRAGAMDDRMQVRPNQRDRSYSDKRVLDYAKLVERDPRLTVTAFALRPLRVRTEPQGWTFELTVTQRRADGD